MLLGPLTMLRPPPARTKSSDRRGETVLSTSVQEAIIDCIGVGKFQARRERASAHREQHWSLPE